jgi:hypothetical protein
MRLIIIYTNSTVFQSNFTYTVLNPLLLFGHQSQTRGITEFHNSVL